MVPTGPAQGAKFDHNLPGITEGEITIKGLWNGDVTIHVPPTQIAARPGSERYRWRKLLARIRQNFLVHEPTVAEIQTGDLVLAFFSGPTPSGWTQLENSPGAFYRTWQNGDQ